jgi:serine/threonine protein kinase
MPGYRRLAKLRHPGIAAVLDVEVDEGCPCLVTQYVPGRRLDEAMREGSMPPRTVAELMAAVAETLAEAHRQGIAHGALRMRSIVALSAAILAAWILWRLLR